MTCINKNHHQKNAFSLIELSVILTLIAIVITSLITIRTSEKKLQRTIGTYEKTETIYDAIKLFIADYERMPCPSEPSIPSSDPDYGSEACTTTTICSNPCTEGNGSIYQGSIPTETLGLNEEFIYDEFGYKLSYIVTVDDTTYDNFSYDYDAITLTNYNDTTIEKTVSLLIISHGENGNGAFYKTKIPKTPSDTSELKNSPINSQGTSITSDFFYGKKTNEFDDIIFSKTKAELINISDENNIINIP